MVHIFKTLLASDLICILRRVCCSLKDYAMQFLPYDNGNELSVIDVTLPRTLTYRFRGSLLAIKRKCLELSVFCGMNFGLTLWSDLTSYQSSIRFISLACFSKSKNLGVGGDYILMR